MFLDRYLLFTSVGLYVLIAVIFDSLLIPNYLKWSFFVIIPVTMLFFFNLDPDNNRRVSELTSTVKALKSPGSVVLISPDYSFSEFAYHYDLNMFKDYKNTVKRLNEDNIFPLRSLVQLPAGVIDSAKHVIYVDCGSAFAFGEDVVRDQLDKKFIRGNRLSVFEIYTICEYYRN
jgi:hypothetical protein